MRRVRDVLVCLAVAVGAASAPASAAGAVSELVGAVHEHTGYSDGKPGTRPLDAYGAGKAAGLDFLFTTEHGELLDFPGTASEDCIPAVGACVVADTVEPENSARKWAAIAEQAAETSDATFTGLRGFEWTSDRHGHINVLLSQNYNSAYVGADNATMEDFWEWFLRSPSAGGGADGLGVFNHPGQKDVSTEDPGRNWNDFAHVPSADGRMVGLEVFGSRDRDYGSVGPGGGYFAHALDRGWHVGAIGAEDSHDDAWGAPDRGKTIVLAEDRSVAAIREALLARRFYAVLGPAQRLTFTVDGAPMGSRLRRTEGDLLTISASGAPRLELVSRGGAVVATGAGTLTVPRPVSDAEPWYFVRARDGAGKVVAYSSPVWVRSDAAEERWLAGDLHVHTCFSHDVYCGPGDDSDPEPWTYGFDTQTRFAEASARGLDFLAITDHNDTRSATDPGFGTSGVVGVPGYEASLRGHAQVLGSDTVLDAGDGSAAAVRALQATLAARGGVLQANHPGYDQSTPFASCASAATGEGLHWKYGYDVPPDTVEVWNPTTLVRTSEAFYDCLLQRGERPALTAGSDSHWASIVAAQGAGNPTTWLLADDPTRDGVLAALRAGRTTTSRTSPSQGGAPLLLEADGNGDEAWTNAIGEEVPAGAPMRVRSASAAASGLVTVTANGASLVNERSLPPGGSVTFTAPAVGWMRAVLASGPTSAADAPGCAPAGQPASTCPYDQALLGMTSAAFVARDGTGGGDDGEAGDDDADQRRPGDGRVPSADATAGGTSASGRRRGRLAPAKLRVRRARVHEGRLDVLAGISRLTSGRVRVTFHAAGRRTRFSVPVEAEQRRIRFRRALPRAQARRGTGILTIRYAGDADTLPRAVRLRAARRRAALAGVRPLVRDGRLFADGRVARAATGTIRVAVAYGDEDGRPRLVAINAPIRRGRWRIDGALLPAAAREEAYASIQYTGSYVRRIRGEMLTYAIGPASG